jgi:hypothetical protein
LPSIVCEIGLLPAGAVTLSGRQGGVSPASMPAAPALPATLVAPPIALEPPMLVPPAVFDVPPPLLICPALPAIGLVPPLPLGCPPALVAEVPPDPDESLALAPPLFDEHARSPALERVVSATSERKPSDRRCTSMCAVPQGGERCEESSNGLLSCPQRRAAVLFGCSKRSAATVELR